MFGIACGGVMPLYSWLFFASLGLGLGATAIAFTFPRPVEQPQLQPA